MELPLISIIIPVYEVEGYLDECVQSVVNQTYSNIEIILIDDGSPDNCPGICDEWAKRDGRIVVVHKVNGGLSDARNAGMSVASGNYIGFVDSDDYIAPDFFEKLYYSLVEMCADIACGSIVKVWDDGREEQMLNSSLKCSLSNEQAMEALLDEKILKKPVWYKLYKRRVVEGIPFEVGKYHEDDFWTYQVIAKTEKVVLVPDAQYYYRQRNGSIMGEHFSIKRIDALEAMALRYDFFLKFYPNLAQRAKSDIYGFSVYLMQKAVKMDANEEKKRVQQEILSWAKKFEPTWQEIRKMPYRIAVWRIVEKTSFVWACRLRNRLGRGTD